MAQAGTVREIVNIQLDRREAAHLLDALAVIGHKSPTVCELEERLSVLLNPVAA